MRSCIFTSYNFQIEQDLIEAQAQTIRHLIKDTPIDFMPLRYTLSEKHILHYQALDYGLNHLFNEGYDNILVLDVDAIPLSTNALLYTFDQIINGIYIGCAQRSMHIENNKHVYIGSPVFGISKSVYKQMGSPSCIFTNRGDTTEELTYIAEENNIPFEILMPSNYEASPYGAPYWELGTPDQRYGIGTTFVNSKNDEMFYHLFESRTNLFNNLFIQKCHSIYKP